MGNTACCDKDDSIIEYSPKRGIFLSLFNLSQVVTFEVDWLQEPQEAYSEKEYKKVVTREPYQIYQIS